jgi:hypothetical protein
MQCTKAVCGLFEVAMCIYRASLDGWSKGLSVRTVWYKSYS